MLSPRPRGQKLAEQREQYKEAGEVDGATALTILISSGNKGFLKDEVGQRYRKGQTIQILCQTDSS